MEQNSPQFVATDIIFHGRNYRPTKSFEVAVANAEKKGSEIARIYGIPRFVIDLKTNLVYLGYEFSPEVTEKIVNGILALPKGIAMYIDPETQRIMSDRQKRKLKNSTKVYRKR